MLLEQIGESLVNERLNLSPFRARQRAHALEQIMIDPSRESLPCHSHLWFLCSFTLVWGMIPWLKARHFRLLRNHSA